MKHVAVIGSTGAVGNEIISLLEKRNFPLKKLSLYASKKSAGKTRDFKNEKITIEELPSSLECDIAFFCAGSTISKEWIPKTKALIIDSSSAFRDIYPLVIPEINPEALKNHQGIITSPNCAATILLMPLFPIHKRYKVKRIVVSTYQAASGGGALLLEQLVNETKANVNGTSFPQKFDFPYAFNLYPHNSSLHSNGYVEEEMKIAQETRKILNDDSIQITASCVRVPVLRAHSLSANVELHEPFCLNTILEDVEKMPGVKLFENRALNRFATPFDASEKEDIYCGRFRIDPTQPNTLEFWAVGDQLLKGAALNAVQIAETTLKSPI